MARPWELTAAHDFVFQFYRSRNYRLAWFESIREVTPFLEGLAAIDREGLRPADYHPRELEALWIRGQTGSSRDRFAAEHALTHAAITAALHLGRGRVDTSAVAYLWDTRPPTVDPAAALARGFARGDVVGELARLAPSHGEYRALRDAWNRFRAETGAGTGAEWPTIPAGPTLRLGEPADSLRVVRLEERLTAEGYLGGMDHAATGDGGGAVSAEDGPTPTAENRGVYDERLREAVRVYQTRNGLEADGMAGRRTLAALNIPAAERLRMLEANLERWRWQDDAPGGRCLRINIPDFSLTLVDPGAPDRVMKVAVGGPGWSTPVFSDSVRYVVINPYWVVPRSIVRRSLIPRIREDLGYLEEQDFEVLSGWGRGAAPVDPETVDWNAPVDDFVYQIRQRPGPANALGRIKFIFPNRYRIYLHDTPSREVFELTAPAVSHGCIRVERPLELAEFLFSGDRGRTFFEEKIEDGNRLGLDLPRRLAVHIEYRTAWVNADGDLEFRRDIYGVDRALLGVLDASPRPGF